MREQHDRLVEQYLARVEQATASLPQQSRDELLSDLREHIDAALAESPSKSEADVRAILERLGDPEEIAAAAGSSPTGTDPAYAPGSRKKRVWLGIGIVAAVVIGIVALCGLVFFSTTERSALSDTSTLERLTEDLSAH